MADVLSFFGIRRLAGLLRRTRTAIERPEELLNRIGNLMMTRIKARTARGVDYEEKRFKPYSPGHAKRRKLAGLPTDRVDLFFTGSMMSAMTYKTGQDQVTLFFANTSDKFGGKNPQKAAFLNEERPFFAISSDDEAAIQEEIDLYIREQTRTRR